MRYSSFTNRSLLKEKTKFIQPQKHTVTLSYLTIEKKKCDEEEMNCTE